RPPGGRRDLQRRDSGTHGHGRYRADRRAFAAGLVRRASSRAAAALGGVDRRRGRRLAELPDVLRQACVSRDGRGQRVRLAGPPSRRNRPCVARPGRQDGAGTRAHDARRLRLRPQRAEPSALHRVRLRALGAAATRGGAGRHRARSGHRRPAGRVTRAATFLGLMLLCPCPWFALAVGGLLPLPVIVAYGTAGGVMLAISLIHLVVYTWIFHKIAWS